MPSCGVSTIDAETSDSIYGSGTGLFNDAVGPGDEDPEEMLDAQALSESLAEVMANINKADRLAVYERRVALREVKELIRQLLVDIEAEPSTPQIATWLASGEDSDTATQFRQLYNEMRRLMDRSRTFVVEIQRLVRDLTAAWDAVGHSPSDLLESKIRFMPNALQASPTMILALQGMVEAWITKRGHDDDDDVNALEKELDTLFADLHTPPFAQTTIRESVRGSSARLASLIARIRASLSGIDPLLKATAAIGVFPRADAASLASRRHPIPAENADERKADELHMMPTIVGVEAWLTKAHDLVKRMSLWELLSGVPFQPPMIVIASQRLPPWDHAGAYMEQLKAAVAHLRQPLR